MKIKFEDSIKLNDIEKMKVKKIMKEYFNDIENNQQFVIEEDNFIIVGIKENNALYIQRVHTKVHSLTKK
jgi:hypothetical protein